MANSCILLRLGGCLWLFFKQTVAPQQGAPADVAANAAPRLNLVVRHMIYQSLTREDFDAMVTGELTHYAIWLENVLIGVISDFFSTPKQRGDFERLLLRRDGLTFQDKIEIVRAMLPLFRNQGAASQLKSLLPKVEEFKANRNAFAHGVDVTPSEISPPTIHVEIVTRSGKEKVVEVTPETHKASLAHAETLLKELQDVRGKLSV